MSRNTITDAQRWCILVNTITEAERWVDLAQEFGCHPSAVRYHARLMQRQGWVCPIYWDPCPVCGELAMTGKHKTGVRIHPWCRAEYRRRSSAADRARHKQEGINDYLRVARWRAQHPERVKAYQATRDQQQALTAGRGHRSGELWTAEDDARIIANWSTPSRVIALELGRSLYAVRRRRWILRQRGFRD